MLELIDLVDAANNVIGVTDVATAHAQKQLHRVIGILLFDAEGKLCLQTGNEYNKYDLSVGGHVGRGETYETAAQREMQEELGIDVPLIHVSTFLSPKAKLGHFWSIYQGELPRDWNFLPTAEVKSITKMTLPEILEKIKLSPELFTPGFVNVFNEFNRVKNNKRS